MATEILGFLIIVGILIVFIVRRDLWNGTSSKADEVEEASMKMRLQMEHTMNTLITQMDSRIHQIEGLVAAADERARALEQQLAAVREEQENTQRRAEQEFAAMRAERAIYYAPPEEPRQYGNVRNSRQVWEDYRRARAAAQDRSLRPIEGVSAVHRAAYASPIRQNRRVEPETFADTLSASMYTAGRGYDNAIPRGQAPYYGPEHDMRYAQGVEYPLDRERLRDARYEDSYREAYESGSYSVESRPEEETWAQYVEPEPPRPSRRAAASRQAQEIPVEMAVEETPAAIVAPSLAPRYDVYAHEDEEEEEDSAFSQEQLEELANTEAEVVVSSSVADVVDLPIDSDEAEETAYEDDPDEDVHAFAEPEEEMTDADALENEEEETSSEMTIAPSDSAEQEEEFADAAENEAHAEEGAEENDEFLMQSGWPEGITEEEEPEGQEKAAQADMTEPQYGEETSAAEEDAEDDILFDELDVKIEEAGTEATGHASEGHAVADDDIRPPSPANRAREMLESGMSPEDVARETGMGRSAVDLLAQMAGSKEKTETDD